MQVLVMFHTRTANTKTLAEHVARGVQQVDGVACVLKQAPDVTQEDLLASDGIIAGTPAYFGGMAAELKTVFERFVHLRPEMTDKVGAAFATTGDPHGGGETAVLSILQAMLINGMLIVGDPLDATGHYGIICSGEPDELTQANAARLGQRVAALVARLAN
jgi:NAD(P)H dehydrogenase (quinone)